MITPVRRPNKRNLFIVGTAAALALGPHAAAEQALSANEVNALRTENAQLRNRLAEMKKKLAQAQRSNGRYSMKKLNSGYANGAGAGKTSTAMTCGANMNMNGGAAGKSQDVGGKTSGEMTCGAKMTFRMPPGSQFYYNPVFGGTDDMFHTHPEGMWMFNVKWTHSEKDGLQSGHSPVGVAEVGPSVLPGAPFPSK